MTEWYSATLTILKINSDGSMYAEMPYMPNYNFYTDIVTIPQSVLSPHCYQYVSA
jgi:hypothetical protein